MEISNINYDVLKRISQLGSNALKTDVAQRALAHEDGLSNAKCIALGASLSLLAKGHGNSMSSNAAYYASQALNDIETLKILDVSEAEGVIASMIFQRLSDADFASIPVDIDEYAQMIKALEMNEFDNPSYVKLAG